MCCFCCCCCLFSFTHIYMHNVIYSFFFDLYTKEIWIRRCDGGKVTAAVRCQKVYIWRWHSVCVCVDDGACGGGCASNRTQAFKYSSYKRCAILLFIYRLHVSDVCLCLVWICVFSLTEGYVQNATIYIWSQTSQSVARCVQRE